MNPFIRAGYDGRIKNDCLITLQKKSESSIFYISLLLHFVLFGLD
jgi:hypothetical protein